jgi:TolB protein
VHSAFDYREGVESRRNDQIAFVSGRDGNVEIYIVHADGSGQINLTRNAAADNSPAWKP